MTNKETVIFIEHILDSINAIQDFSKDLTKKELESNRLKRSAIVRELEIVGEATKNIPQPFRERYSELPWKKIAGTRDKIIHHYFGIDLDVIWSVIKEDFPRLKNQILKIKRDLDKETKP